jgi:hypothetical protein
VSIFLALGVSEERFGKIGVHVCVPGGCCQYTFAILLRYRHTQIQGEHVVEGLEVAVVPTKNVHCILPDNSCIMTTNNYNSGLLHYMILYLYGQPLEGGLVQKC